MNKQQVVRHMKDTTIGFAAVQLIRDGAELDKTVKAIHRKFPKSHFGAASYYYYSSLSGRGLIGRPRKTVKH